MQLQGAAGMEELTIAILMLLAVACLGLLWWNATRLRKIEERYLAQVQSLTRRVFELEQLAGVREARPPVPASDPAEGLHKAAQTRAPRDWESLLGANWMNKAGVLITIIGLALFLAYAFTLIGPPGRVTLAAASSVAMLAAGVWLEPREAYAVFARGLIGGGWAGLYLTTYAAHGVEAARVIENPSTATFLLLAVSGCMLLHSLRYRSQTITGMAYFAVFASLALSPLSLFAVLALAPLAASLLFVTHRFSWPRLAIPAVAATYGLYLFHASRLESSSVWGGQAVLLVYWLLFEAYDVLDERQRLFPLNALGWVTLSWLTWNELRPGEIYQFFALATAVYLLSMMARIRLGRRRFEWPLTVAAVSAAAGLATEFTGATLTLFLLLEAEILYLAGLVWRHRWVRWLAGLAFGAATLGLLDYVGRSAPASGLIPWTKFSVVAVIEASLCYFNRAIGRSRAYGYLAAALLAAVVPKEFRAELIGVAWLGLAAALAAASLYWRLSDFRWQAYAAGGAATLSLFAVNGLHLALHSGEPHWAPQVIGVIFLYGVALLARRVSQIRSRERQALQTSAWISATVLLALLLKNVVPASGVTVAWGVQGVLTLAIGFFARSMQLRITGLAVLAVCTLKLFFYDLRNLETLPRILSFVLLGVIMIGASWVYTRYRERIARML